MHVKADARPGGAGSRSEAEMAEAQASVSGERFEVEYLLAGGEGEVRAVAYDICLEQTVEFPEELLPPGLVGEEVVGRVEALSPASPGRWHARVSYAVETTASSAESGIAHGVLFGQLMRLAGADATIYPKCGGRFSFTRNECVDIARASAEPLGALRAALPAPGGGMTEDRVADMLDAYGRDFVLLMGGGLHRRSPDLVGNARHFVELLEAI
jgi:hypothetical protein